MGGEEELAHFCRFLSHPCSFLLARYFPHKSLDLIALYLADFGTFEDSLKLNFLDLEFTACPSG